MDDDDDGMGGAAGLCRVEPGLCWVEPGLEEELLDAGVLSLDAGDATQ